MRAVNIGDLKNNLSRYLNEVRRGSEVVIKDRNRPIARIVPISTTADDEDELLELIAEGAVRAPRIDDALPRSFWSQQLPSSDVDVSALIREDRDAR
jgi:prevent-host-death family protein